MNALIPIHYKFVGYGDLAFCRATIKLSASPLIDSLKGRHLLYALSNYRDM